MDGKQLGRRLKEARLAKKMTQSEVVGTFITRNMLSQIESGAATPSVKTLEYLSEVLDMPMSQLVAEPSVDSGERLLSAKAEYKIGEYNNVIEIIREPDAGESYYDELCALLSISYEKLGNTEMSDKYSKLGIYAKDDAEK